MTWFQKIPLIFIKKTNEFYTFATYPALGMQNVDGMGAEGKVNRVGFYLMRGVTENRRMGDPAVTHRPSVFNPIIPKNDPSCLPRIRVGHRANFNPSVCVCFVEIK